MMTMITIHIPNPWWSKGTPPRFVPIPAELDSIDHVHQFGANEWQLRDPVFQWIVSVVVGVVVLLLVVTCSHRSGRSNAGAAASGMLLLLWQS